MIIPSQNKKSEFTKEKLSDALFLLMEKEEFTHITVLQICQHADVSRAAFYRNFETKEDILEYEVQKKIQNYIVHVSKDPEEVLFDELSFINFWAKEKYLFQLLDKNNLTGIFTKQIQHFYTQYLYELYKNQEPYLDYLAGALASGTVSLLSVWFSRGCKESDAELLEIIKQLRDKLMR